MYKKLLIIAILSLFIFCSLFFITKTEKEEKITYKVSLNDKTCYETLNEIYRDNDYIYYLSCYKDAETKVSFSNGKSYTVKEALEKKLLNIDDLDAKGLKIEKYKIEEEINNDYIEEVPKNSDKFLKLVNDDLIMNEEEIERYNQNIKEKVDMIYDMDIKSITKKEILKYIESYSIPSLPKYNGSKEVTKEQINSILDNRNLSNVKDLDNIQKGIIINRANLRSFPTDIHFNSYRNDNNFDRIQETELLFNTPVLIVHESKDKLWDFVITPFYTGWVKKDDIALATDEDYDFFINNPFFVVITDKTYKIDNINLDMSVILPYIGYIKDGYQLLIPQKDEDGYVTRRLVTVPRNKAHIGYLPYTKRNLIIQAFKYEGERYSWSGLDSGVDCSSYVSNVFRSFGIMFPRNTSSQNKSVGTIISVASKSTSDKLKLIEQNNLSLLYQDGHVMLYIGKVDGKDYIIHSSGTDLKVEVTVLNNSSYLKNINKVIKVDKSFIS